MLPRMLFRAGLPGERCHHAGGAGREAAERSVNGGRRHRLDARQDGRDREDDDGAGEHDASAGADRPRQPAKRAPTNAARFETPSVRIYFATELADMRKGRRAAAAS